MLTRKIGFIIVVAAGVALARFAAAPAATAGKPIGGIQCERQEYGDFHIHAHLDIFVDGKAYEVPPFIGIVEAEKCLYWLHTHDPSGVVHVEAPVKRVFTLAQFFEIWKATAKPPPVAKQAPKIFVNGKKASAPLDRVEIEPLAEIVVVYGKEPATIPSTYSFGKGA